MEVFIEKFCRRYNLSETDVKALTEQMQEVRFRKKEAIVIEGERNSNLYLIKEGIWRGHYLKDGTDTTIWFASVGEIAFSIWGYADNSISQISIEACNDSIAYSIPDFNPGNPGIIATCPAKTHRFLSVDHPAVTEPDSGKNKAIEQEFRV